MWLKNVLLAFLLFTVVSWQLTSYPGNLTPLKKINPVAKYIGVPLHCNAVRAQKPHALYSSIASRFFIIYFFNFLQ
jgi:hypothetical protein